MARNASTAAIDDLTHDQGNVSEIARSLLQKIRRLPQTVRSVFFWKCLALHRHHPQLVDLLFRYAPIRTRRAVPTPMGFKMAGGSSIVHWLMRNGEFEREELDLLLGLMDEADVFVDVGANIGYYSLLARYRQKQVVAVEPQATNFRFLCESLVANGWLDAEAYPVGLGRQPGIATLYGISSTGASLLPGWAGASTSWRQIIPVTTLDRILAGRFLDRRILVKIDVEGAEHDVLLGAAETMSRIVKPTFLVEICLGEFSPNGNTRFSDTFRLFRQSGYECRLPGAEDRLVTPADVERWASAGRTDTGAINYLFTPCSAA